MRISDWSSDVCSSDLVDLFGDIAAGEDSGSAAAAVASDLRSAYVDQDRDDRLSALRALWDAGDDPFDRYGRLVMTARDAARVAPAAKTAEADAIHAAPPTAGFDRPAVGWQPDHARDGRSVVWGRSVTVRSDLGGRRII